jgi:predicted CopG family antitoxin
MISVKEKIYKQLEQVKNPGESFSDLLERLKKTLNVRYRFPKKNQYNN